MKRALRWARAWVGALLCAFALSGSMLAAGAPASAVVRATLANGLEVVIVPNALALVVSTSLNYRVGSDQSPAGFPGMAHALEHMMFRGSPGLSAPALSRISNLIGGHFNANTRSDMTQYYYTVPATDLEIALRIEAARMADIDCTDEAWNKERGAIEQEVAAHLSSPNVQMIQKVKAALFAGTPYAEHSVGTRDSFDKTTATQLKDFHKSWYAPNNAVLIVTGNVDPSSALKKIEAIFSPIAAKSLPPKAPFVFKPVVAQRLALETDKPYAMVYLAFRVAGMHDTDLPALELLSDVMESQRYDLYALKVQGKALSTFFEYEPMGASGMVLIGAAFPASGDVQAAARAMQDRLQAILANVAASGVPAELIEAAKQQERREQAQLMNSIPGQASVWANALVQFGLSSPEEDLKRIEAVSVDDVNRVAKTYFDPAASVVAVLTPAPSGAPMAAKETGHGESVAMDDAGGAVVLPDWAQSAFATLPVPAMHHTPVTATLKNGLRVIVQPVAGVGTISVRGYIRNRASLQEPVGKDGVSLMTAALMSFGTQNRDRLAFRAAVDAIGAQVSAGTSFSTTAMPKDFDTAVMLLADNVRNPALPASGLDALKPQYAAYFANRRQSPDYKADRAMEEALLPATDPDLREPTPESLRALTREDLVAYHTAVFRPDMAAIVVIGDISAVDATTVIEKYFGTWKAVGPKPVVVPKPVADNRAKTVSVPDASRVQDDVAMGQTLRLTRTSVDYAPMYLGNAILGGSAFSAKLFEDLREKRGLVYFVGSHLGVGRTRGRFSVSFASDPDKVETAVKLVRRDIAAMQSAPVSPEDLTSAKAMLLRQIPLNEDNVGTIADGLLGRFDAGLPYDEPVRLARKLAAVSASDVQKAFAKWLRPDDLVVVSQGPAPK